MNATTMYYNKAFDVKVWNLSLGSVLPISKNFISPEAAELDRIQSEYDVVFVVAGTNKKGPDLPPAYPIGAPADSLNSLVVNSVRKDHEPASYHRVGPVLSFFHKPDVSYYGGDSGERMSGYANYNPYAAQAILSSLPCPDNLIPTKIALHKSNEWKHEAEWRLFCSSSDDQDFQNGAHGHFTLKPSALYLGRRISSIYEKILSDIAKEKGLPIYKMSLDDDSISYDLIPEQVE